MSKAHQVQHQLPIHEFIEFKLHPRNDKILVCIEKQTNNPHNQDFVFEDIIKQGQKDFQGVIQKERIKNEPIIKSRLERIQTFKQEKLKRTLASKTTIIREKEEEKKQKEENDFIIDSVRKVKAKSFQDGVLKTEYLISFWDIEQNIPLQILEQILPEDEKILYLGFSDQMKPFIVSRKEDVEEVKEGEQIEEKKEEKPFAKSLFPDSPNKFKLKSSVGKRQPAMKDQESKKVNIKVSYFVRVFIEGKHFDSLNLESTTEIQACPKSTPVASQAIKIASIAPKTSPEIQAKDPCRVAVEGPFIFYWWDNEHRTGSVKKLQELGGKNYHMAQQKIGEPKENAILRENHTCEIETENKRKIIVKETYLKVFKTPTIYFSINSSLSQHEQITVMKVDLEAQTCQKMNTYKIENCIMSFDFHMNKDCKNLVITMLQKSRFSEAVLVIDTNDFQRFFIKYQEEKVHIQSNQRFSETLGGFLISPSQLNEQFIIDLQDERVEPMESRCFKKFKDQKINKLKKEIFFNDQTMVEVMKFSDKQDLEVCHYQRQDSEFNEQKLHQLREYSHYQFKHPYLITCKGNAELIVNSMPFKDKTLIFPIKDCKNIFSLFLVFLSFVDAADDNLDTQIKHLIEQYQEKKEERRHENEEAIEFIKAKKDTIIGAVKIVFSFLTLSNSGLFLNKLILLPHTAPSFKEQICVHLKTRKDYQQKDPLLKWMNKGFISKQILPHANQKLAQDILFAQYDDCIQVSSLFSDYKDTVSVYADKLKPINMVETNLNCRPGVFYVVDENIGSSIKVFSLRQGIKETQKTVYSSQGTKIVAIARRFDKFYVVDDTWGVQEFQIKGFNEAEKELDLRPIRKLEFMHSQKKLMEDLELSIIYPFASFKVTNNQSFKFSNFCSKMYDDSIELHQDQLSYQVINQSRENKQQFKYQAYEAKIFDEREGFDSEIQIRIKALNPEKLSEEEQKIYGKGNFKKKLAIYSPYRDSQYNLCLTGQIKFSSFLPTNTLGKERILVHIGQQFLIIDPLGVIQREINIIEQIIEPLFGKKISLKDKMTKLESFKVEKVSINSQFYTFNFGKDYKDEDNKLDQRDVISYKNIIFQLYWEETAKPYFLPLRAFSFKDNEMAKFLSEKIKQVRLEGKDSEEEDGVVIYPKDRDLIRFMIAETRPKASQSFDYDITNDGQFIGLQICQDTEQQFMQMIIVNNEILRPSPSLANSLKKVSKLPFSGQSWGFCKIVALKNSFVFTVLPKSWEKMEYAKVYHQKFDWKKLREEDFCLKLNTQFLKPDQGEKKWRLVDIWGVNAENKIQLILENLVEKERALVLSWDLVRNVEDRHTEASVKNLALQRGINSTLNFAGYTDSVRNSRLVDLEFNFQMHFFKTIEMKDKNHPFSELRKPLSYESTVSEAKNLWAQVRGNHLIIQQSTTKLLREKQDLLYELLDNQNENLVRRGLPISNLQMRDSSGRNIFHYLILAKNTRMVKKFFNKLEKFIHLYQDEETREKLSEVYLMILYPNISGRSPLHYAMRLSSQFIEVFLEMLSKVGHYQISRHIFQDLEVFRKLIRLNLPIFQDFLAACSFQPFSMQQVVQRKWPYRSKESWSFSISDCLVPEQVYEQKIGKQKELTQLEKSLQSLKRKSQQQLAQSQKQAQYLTLEQRVEDVDKIQAKLGINAAKSTRSEYYRLKTKIIEFDWIFKSSSAKMFVDELANCDNRAIFEVDTIKESILFLWNTHFYTIFRKLFLPYVIFALLFVTYSCFIFNPDYEGRLKTQNWIFSIICLLFSLYEMRKQVKFVRVTSRKRLLQLQTFWNLNDLCSSILAVTFCLIDIFNKQHRQRNKFVGSVAIMLIWLKFFYYLRIFAPTSAFIRMIIEIVKDMSTFLMILFASILAFSNVFFILDGAIQGKEILKASGGDVWLTFTSTYMMGLGEWETDLYGDSPHTLALWIFFVLCTFLVQIVLLNLLIAIMEDTFDKVSEVREQALLQEICKIISENWLMVRSQKNFKNAKYILVAEKEKAENTLDQNWEGRLSALKAFFDQQGKDLEDIVGQTQLEHRDEILELEYKIESKLRFMLNQISKRDNMQDNHDTLINRRIKEMMEGNKSIRSMAMAFKRKSTLKKKEERQAQKMPPGQRLKTNILNLNPKERKKEEIFSEEDSEAVFEEKKRF